MQAKQGWRQLSAAPNRTASGSAGVFPIARIGLRSGMFTARLGASYRTLGQASVPAARILGGRPVACLMGTRQQVPRAGGFVNAHLEECSCHQARASTKNILECECVQHCVTSNHIMLRKGQGRS
jgi:hypothetical protein